VSRGAPKPSVDARPAQAHNRGGWDQGREAATGRVGPGAVLAAMEVLRRVGYLVRVSTGPPALPDPDTVLLMYGRRWRWR
jgi:hypothetical protein